ncbi:MAG TPA: DUF5666 domain-containing protein [Terriglobales bacterium]|nr:DUF5666 domain-containing protein [Terriglobales bacterium]
MRRLSLLFPLALAVPMCGVFAAAQSNQAVPKPPSDVPAPASSAVPTRSGVEAAAASPATAPDPGPKMPTTTIFDPSATGAPAAQKGPDPYLDVPPMPEGKVTLIGGHVRSMDGIRSRMTIEPFGGGKSMKVRFDERTHIYRDGVETTQLAIHKGDRVWVDTMLDGPHVFARNIHVRTQSSPADARGQVLGYDARNGVVSVRDELSLRPVRFRVDNATRFSKQGETASAADLQPGALISVRFAAGDRSRGVAQEIAVLAVPGAPFTFAGTVTYLNLATGVMAVHNQSDDKTYELSFDPARVSRRDGLRVGSQVTVTAQFQPRGYRATSVEVAQTKNEE